MNENPNGIFIDSFIFETIKDAPQKDQLSLFIAAFNWVVKREEPIIEQLSKRSKNKWKNILQPYLERQIRLVKTKVETSQRNKQYGVNDTWQTRKQITNHTELTKLENL